MGGILMKRERWPGELVWGGHNTSCGIHRRKKVGGSRRWLLMGITDSITGVEEEMVGRT